MTSRRRLSITIHLIACAVLVAVLLTAEHYAFARRAYAAKAPECTTGVMYRDVKGGLDDWWVHLMCNGNSTDKTQYVRGVLVVRGASDAHTKWVEIPPHTWSDKPARADSPWAHAPYADPTARVETYKCPPVSIGSCRPDNPYNQAIIAFGDLL